MIMIKLFEFFCHLVVQFDKLVCNELIFVPHYYTKLMFLKAK